MVRQTQGMKISHAQLDHFARLVSQHPAQALKELQASESTYSDDYYRPSGWYEVYGGLTKYVCGCFTWGETYTNDRFVNPNFAHACDETDTYYRPNGYIFYGDGT